MAYVLKAGAAVHGLGSMIERSDGFHIAAVVHIEPVKDVEGNVIGAISCIYDISHRKRATDDLARGRAALEADQHILQKQDAQRFAATYEHATVGIAEVDAQGRRLRVNGAAWAITGRSRTELTGGSVFDVLHSEDRYNDVNQYRQLVAGETDRYSIESESFERTAA